MRILLVEDESHLAAQLRQTLEEAGYVVDTAGNGRDAWQLGGEQTYDVVVLDLGLPVLDGLSVLKRWRSEGMVTPVLILTARDQWHEKVAGIDAGADDYLTKPFHNQELHARLKTGVRLLNMRMRLSDRIKQLEEQRDPRRSGKDRQGLLQGPHPGRGPYRFNGTRFL